MGQVKDPALPQPHREPEEQGSQEIRKQYDVEEHIIHAGNMLGSSEPLWRPRAVWHQGLHGRTAAIPWPVPPIASYHTYAFPLAPRRISATIIRIITRLCQAQSEPCLWGGAPFVVQRSSGKWRWFRRTVLRYNLDVPAVCIHTETLENSAHYRLY